MALALTQSTKPLIGLTGHKGAGKDTVAGILKRLYGYERKAWADALKREVYNAFGRYILVGEWEGMPGDDPQYDTPLQEYATFGRWLAFIDAHKHDAPDTEYGWIRPLLQFWGTEYRRNLCGDDYWTRQLQLAPGVVVSDCRFPNEVQAIHKAGGKVWRVERRGYTGDDHASERFIDSLPADLFVLNDGSVDDLEQEVAAVYESTIDNKFWEAVTRG
jgi:hypothetical protein